VAEGDAGGGVAAATATLPTSSVTAMMRAEILNILSRFTLNSLPRSAGVRAQRFRQLAALLVALEICHIERHGRGTAANVSSERSATASRLRCSCRDLRRRASREPDPTDVAGERAGRLPP